MSSTLFPGLGDVTVLENDRDTISISRYWIRECYFV